MAYRAIAGLFVMTLATGAAFAAAQNVPQFNVEPSCRAAEVSAIGQARTLSACMKDEDNARATLTQQWTQFLEADRTQCLGLATMGGPKSYVELLTCLEMARDVRKLHETNQIDIPRTTGVGGAGGLGHR